MSIFDFFKKNSKNSDLYAAIKALEKTEILMMPQENGNVKHPGVSKIGGKPYLPADFEWPTFTSADDDTARPLSFLCQINLTEVKPYDKDGALPGRGTLYFFYECESSCWGFDPQDHGAARVFWCDTTDLLNCVPLEIPADIAEEHAMPEIALQFKARKSYPKFEEFEVYSDLEPDWEEYDGVLEKLGVDVDEDSEDHKLLGYADIIQNEMLTECERTSRGLYCGDPGSYRNTPKDVEADIAKHASEWTLLLQLSTITKGDFEWMFGDCGMLYFYIRKEDLSAMRFDKASFSVQCG